MFEHTSSASVPREDWHILSVRRFCIIQNEDTSHKSRKVLRNRVQDAVGYAINMRFLVEESGL